MPAEPTGGGALARKDRPAHAGTISAPPGIEHRPVRSRPAVLCGDSGAVAGTPRADRGGPDEHSGASFRGVCARHRSIRSRYSLTADLGRARISLEVALAVVALSLTFGSAIGAIAGYAGGWVERVMMVLQRHPAGLPRFPAGARAGRRARGSSLENVILAVSIAYTPRVAPPSCARSFITIRPRPFIEASRAIGMSSSRVLLRHVLPNALPPVIVVTTVSAATAILAEAGLSYLGLGVQPPDRDLGQHHLGRPGFHHVEPVDLIVGRAVYRDHG